MANGAGSIGSWHARIAFAALLGAMTPGPTSAQTDATWNDGDSLYADPLNWDIGRVPINSIVETFHAIIDNGPSVTVNLNADTVIVALTLGTDLDVLILDDPDDDLVFTVADAVDNAGTIQVRSDQTRNQFHVDGGTLVNSNVVRLDAGGNLDKEAELAVSGLVTLSGGGTVRMSDDIDNEIFGTAGTFPKLTNVDNTIEGAGAIGTFFRLTFENGPAGTVLGNATNTALRVITTASVINRGTMAAEDGAELIVIDPFGTGDCDNAGGVIEAGAGSTVKIDGASIRGGRVQSTAGGIVVSTFRTKTFEDVTLAGLYDQIHGITFVRGTLTNEGNMLLGFFPNQVPEVIIDGDVTLNGGGTILMSDSVNNRIGALNGGDKLINVDNTITGSGAMGIFTPMQFENQAGGSVVAIGPTESLFLTPTDILNRGEMRAEAGARLQFSDVVIDNVGAEIVAAGKVEFEGGFTGTHVIGGTLRSTGTGAFSSEASRGTTLENLTVDGRYELAFTNRPTILAGAIFNLGLFSMQAAGGSTLDHEIRIKDTVTLTGGGQIVMSDDRDNEIVAAPGSANPVLINQDNTIRGAGELGLNGLSIINRGLIHADQPSFLRIQTGGAPFTNEGTLRASGGDAIVIISLAGEFTNFAAGTLTGGAYELFDDRLVFSDADIQTNAATILLDGATAEIVDLSVNDALANFANNAAAGDFTIRNGRNLTTAGDLGNAGGMHIGATSELTVGAGGANTYTQTDGSTTVDGVLAAALVDVQGGTLEGSGTVAGLVQNAGTTAPAGTTNGEAKETDATVEGGSGQTIGVLTIDQDYTQAVTGRLVIEIGAAGHDRLVVNGQAIPAGQLVVELLDGFMPDPSDVFEFLSTSVINGQFLNVIDNRVSVAGGTFGVTVNPTGMALSDFAPDTGPPNAVPAVSETGLIILALLMLLGRMVIHERGSSVASGQSHEAR